MAEVEEALEAKLAPLRQRYPQYSISVKPPEQAEEMKRWAIKVGVACVGLVFLTLVFVLKLKLWLLFACKV